MARVRSRVVETESVNQRMLRRGAVKRQHISRWAVGNDELAPGVVGDIHLDPSAVEVIREVSSGSGVGQLLVLSATAVDIDDAGYVTFDSITHQHGFDGVTAAGDSITWPVSAVGGAIVTFAWDTFTGGGLLELEVDGTVPAWGTIAAGSVGAEGRGEIGVDIAEGSTVKLKVTHGEVTAQTATVTLYLKVEDPVAEVAGGLLETAWLDSRVGSVTTTTVLDNGVVYLVRVTGNMRHNPSASVDEGSPDPILFPSPTFGADNAMRDAEMFYAHIDPGSYPEHAGTGHGSPFELNAGSGWAHIEPDGGPFTSPEAGHEYDYRITGEGTALQARITDSILTDNNGMFKIEVYR